MMLGTGYAAFQLIRTQLYERMTTQLQETYTVIAQSYGDRELKDLFNIAQSNVTANLESERVFLLLGPGGSRLSGSMATMPSSADGSIVTAEELGLPASNGSYRIRRGDIGAYPLLIGMSFAESQAKSTIVLQSLALGDVAFSSPSFSPMLLRTPSVTADRHKNRAALHLHSNDIGRRHRR